MFLVFILEMEFVMANKRPASIAPHGAFARLISAVCDRERFTKETVFDVRMVSPNGVTLIEVPSPVFSSRSKFAGLVLQRCGWPLAPKARGVSWPSEIGEALRRGEMRPSAGR